MCWRIGSVFRDSLLEIQSGALEVVRGPLVQMEPALQVILVGSGTDRILPRQSLLERPAEFQPELIGDLRRELLQSI